MLIVLSVLLAKYNYLSCWNGSFEENMVGKISPRLRCPSHLFHLFGFCCTFTQHLMGPFLPYWQNYSKTLTTSQKAPQSIFFQHQAFSPFLCLDFPPVFHIKLKDQVLLEGEAVQLCCLPAASPAPQILWMKGRSCT